jgi:hypothetical protein
MSSPSGFEEARPTFQYQGFAEAAGNVRRFGPDGPAYEVIDNLGGDKVSIQVIESGECLDYPLTAMLADPIAETVP